MKNLITVFVLLLPLVQWDFIQAETVLCAGGRLRGLMCYMIYNDALSWNQAELSCQSKGGHLAAVTDDGAQDTILTYMADQSVTDIWIGGEEKVDGWSWIQDDSVIAAQGCYLDQPGDRDLSHKSPIDPVLVTPDSCISYCRNNSYKYAGVQLSDRAEEECFCGDTYGKHGKTSGCTQLCVQRDPVTNDPFYCGDFGSNFVYSTSGGYGEWAFNQPNSWDGYQFCAAMDSASSGYKFADETCKNSFFYMCDINTAACTGTGFNTLNGQCVYISDTEKSWFQAKTDCVSRGGDLVKIDSKEKHDLIKDNIKETGSKHWIGLISHRWSWTDGSDMHYFNFATDQPDSSLHKCLHISESLSFRWSDADCSQTKSYLCQRDLTTTTAAPTTIPTTISTASTSKSVTTGKTTAVHVTTTNKPQTTQTTATSKNVTTNKSTAVQTAQTTATTKSITTSKSTAGQVTTTNKPKSTQTSNPPTTTSIPSTVTIKTTASPVPSTDNVTVQNDVQVTTSSINIQPPGEPGLGASTDVSGLSVSQIVLIVLGVVVLIVLITFIAIFIMYRQKKNRSRVNPEKTYDARSSASVANSGTDVEYNQEYGDQVYLHKQDLYDKPPSSARLGNGYDSQSNGRTPRIDVNDN